MIDWDDPEARARLIERVGSEAYTRAWKAHQLASIIEIAGGHALRPIRSSRWGRLIQVGETGRAFGTLEAARDWAEAHGLASTDELADELADWCRAENLPPRSADELLHEEISAGQRRWLSAFCERWDIAQSREDLESACRARGEDL